MYHAFLRSILIFASFHFISFSSLLVIRLCCFHTNCHCAFVPCDAHIDQLGNISEFIISIIINSICCRIFSSIIAIQFCCGCGGNGITVSADCTASCCCIRHFSHQMDRLCWLIPESHKLFLCTIDCCRNISQFEICIVIDGISLEFHRFSIDCYFCPCSIGDFFLNHYRCFRFRRWNHRCRNYRCRNHRLLFLCTLIIVLHCVSTALSVAQKVTQTEEETTADIIIFIDFQLFCDFCRNHIFINAVADIQFYICIINQIAPPFCDCFIRGSRIACFPVNLRNDIIYPAFFHPCFCITENGIIAFCPLCCRTFGIRCIIFPDAHRADTKFYRIICFFDSLIHTFDQIIHMIAAFICCHTIPCFSFRQRIIGRIEIIIEMDGIHIIIFYDFFHCIADIFFYFFIGRIKIHGIVVSQDPIWMLHCHIIFRQNR